ncbi:MAG TPA: hypothetical protein VMD55_09865, partial [Terracidiphilus sp.]|nr:hypothetical protein [Terracidiphilus sp.]
MTIVSVASTYFDVLAHRHVLRQELENRARWMGMSIEPDVQGPLAAGDPTALAGVTQLLKAGTGALGIVVYDAHGHVLGSAGPSQVIRALGRGVAGKSLQKGIDVSAFGHAGQWRWMQEAFPIHDGRQLMGGVTIVVDAGYIHEQDLDLWRRSFWRVLALVILIVAITMGMVGWF